jgi:hypothetical protein
LNVPSRFVGHVAAKNPAHFRPAKMLTPPLKWWAIFIDVELSSAGQATASL